MLQVGVCVVDDGRQCAVDCVESEECCRSACAWLMMAGSVRLTVWRVSSVAGRRVSG